MYRYGVRLSVYLSVPSIDSSSDVQLHCRSAGADRYLPPTPDGSSERGRVSVVIRGGSTQTCYNVISRVCMLPFALCDVTMRCGVCCRAAGSASSGDDVQ